MSSSVLIHKLWFASQKSEGVWSLELFLYAIIPICPWGHLSEVSFYKWDIYIYIYVRNISMWEMYIYIFNYHRLFWAQIYWLL
jgi:hypothetical protein